MREKTKRLEKSNFSSADAMAHKVDEGYGRKPRLYMWWVLHRSLGLFA